MNLSFTAVDLGYHPGNAVSSFVNALGVSVSLTTMGRVLKRLKVRRGRPKPNAPCRWSEPARKRRVAVIHALIERLPANQAAVWKDEADLDLNPKIGFDYMLPGTQRQVMTPGKNVKRYLAGALDARTDRVIWVKGERKNSRLFIELLKKLLKELCRLKSDSCGVGQLHHPQQQAGENVAYRVWAEIQAAFSAAVLSG